MNRKDPPTWKAFGVLAALLVLLNVLTLSLVYYSNSQIEEQLEQASAALSSQIAASEQALREQDVELGDRIDASVMALRQESEARENDLRVQLTGLEGQLGEVEERSSALEQQVVDLNIQSQDFSAIIEDTLEGVVSIITDRGLGSGAVVDRRGYVVTNAHVVAGISQAGAKMIEGDIRSIRIVAADAEADLALLHLSGSGFDALEFEPASNVRVGTKVIALGSPAGLDFTVTEGIVSATGRENDYGVPVIQIDVPINPGNSGGPIVNINGRIVGISTYKARGYESLGFAVESDVVEDFVEEAIAADIAAQADT